MGVLDVIRSLVQPPSTVNHAAVEHAIRRADAELTVAELRLRRLEARRAMRAARAEHAPREEA